MRESVLFVLSIIAVVALIACGVALFVHIVSGRLRERAVEKERDRRRQARDKRLDAIAKEWTDYQKGHK